MRSKENLCKTVLSLYSATVVRNWRQESREGESGIDYDRPLTPQPFRTWFSSSSALSGEKERNLPPRGRGDKPLSHSDSKGRGKAGMTLQAPPFLYSGGSRRRVESAPLFSPPR